MKTIDVRNNDEENEVGKIIFSEGCHLKNDSSDEIALVDHCGDVTDFPKRDIDNLIKALELAKKEWCE